MAGVWGLGATGYGVWGWGWRDTGIGAIGRGGAGVQNTKTQSDERRKPGNAQHPRNTSIKAVHTKLGPAARDLGFLPR
jgi:hypothetical protein